GKRKKSLPPPPPKPVVIGPVMDKTPEAMEIVKKPPGRSKWPTFAGALLGAALGLVAFLLDLQLSQMVVQTAARLITPAAEQAVVGLVPVVGAAFGGFIGFVINELI